MRKKRKETLQQEIELLETLNNKLREYEDLFNSSCQELIKQYNFYPCGRIIHSVVQLKKHLPSKLWDRKTELKIYEREQELKKNDKT